MDLRARDRNGSGRHADRPAPAPGALDVSGLRLPDESLRRLLSVDVDGWLAELPATKKHLERFGARLPQGLKTSSPRSSSACRPGGPGGR